jgi:Flp pilus assembly protein TadD
MATRMIRLIAMAGLVIGLAACAASPTPSATPLPSPTLTASPTRTPTATPGAGLAELLATPGALAASADPASAEAAYRALIDLYPHRADPWLGLAALAQQQGDQQQALDDLHQAIQAQPDNFEAYRQLALLTQQHDEYANLSDIYLQMLKIAPDDPDLLLAFATAQARIGDANGALASLARAEDIDPNRAYAWVPVVEAASSAGQYPSAIVIANEGLGRHPEQSSLQFERGLAYLSTSDAQSALSDFDAVLAVEPASFRAMRWRGRALAELGRTEEAINTLQAAAELGQLSDAISVNESYEAMSDAADLISQSDPGAAFEYLAKQVIQHGSRDALLLGYARVRWRQGNASLAIRQLDSLVLSDYIPALYWRGLIYANAGDKGQAVVDLRAYLAIYRSGLDAAAAYRLLDSLGG